DPGPLCRAGSRGTGLSGDMQDFNKHGIIINLNEALWEDIVTEPSLRQELWLVVTFTPWCVRCEGVLNSLAKLHSDSSIGRRTRLAALNCHAHQKLCDDLGLLGHPLVTMRYGGSNEAVTAALSSWRTSQSDSQWLPANWTFASATRGPFAALLAALPPEFKAPILAASSAESPAGHACPQPSNDLRSAQEAAIDAADTSEVPSVGRDLLPAWPVPPELLTADALLAYAESLRGSGANLGLRELAAMEAWLVAFELRLPETVGSSPVQLRSGLLGPLSDVRGFVSQSLHQALVAGSAHAVCAPEWSSRSEPLIQALLAMARQLSE
ncbi:unnamed protein product, partial [Polarella glacialis]